nr:integrase core domain-containing protein [Sulfurihydrogenibium subterraneum]
MEEELWLIEKMEYTIDEMNRRLSSYVEKYNFIRPHYSLGYKTPADMLNKM